MARHTPHADNSIILCLSVCNGGRRQGSGPLPSYLGQTKKPASIIYVLLVGNRQLACNVPKEGKECVGIGLMMLFFILFYFLFTFSTQDCSEKYCKAVVLYSCNLA